MSQWNINVIWCPETDTSKTYDSVARSILFCVYASVSKLLLIAWLFTCEEILLRILPSNIIAIKLRTDRKEAHEVNANVQNVYT